MTVRACSTALAERNTRPQVPSDESTRHKLNGLLCVDALTTLVVRPMERYFCPLRVKLGILPLDTKLLKKL